YDLDVYSCLVCCRSDGLQLCGDIVASTSRYSSSLHFHPFLNILSTRLFPYPTLFRSADDADPPDRGPHRRGPLYPARPRHQGIGNRKSTRLNSSHVSISYAVFCLKKKNMS